MTYPTLKEIFWSKKPKKYKEFETVEEALERLNIDIGSSSFLLDPDPEAPKKYNIKPNLTDFWREYPPGTPILVLSGMYRDGTNLLTDRWNDSTSVKGQKGFIDKGEKYPFTSGTISKQYWPFVFVVPQKKIAFYTRPEDILLLKEPKRLEAHPYR